MQFMILPTVDRDIRCERCKMKNMTVCVKDVFYVIAIVLNMSSLGLYRVIYYKDDVVTIYFRLTERISIQNCQR